MRGRFIKKKNYELNLSLGGALPSNSKDNSTRAGMPDLDTMVEFGPGFIYHFINTKKYKLKLNIPVRFTISSDLTRIDDRGMVFNPLLFYIHNGFLSDDFILFSALSTRFASRQFHKYIYQVDPVYATASRPTYDAKGGYLSTSLNVGLGYSFKMKYMAFVAVRNSFLQGNANLESPLLVKKNNTSVAFGFIWWAWQSRLLGHQ